MKVGELAKTTGITVRTLHHYDDLGLLRPSGRTDSGHRLYTAIDVKRLQHIVALRQLGFSLEQIAAALKSPDASLLKTISAVKRELLARRHEIDGLIQRLALVEESMVTSGDVSTEHMLKLIEGMTMYEKYFTKEQLASIKARGEAMGSARVQEATLKDWPELIAAVRVEMENDTDPSAAHVQELACRWKALVAEFTGDDPGIQSGLRKMYQQDPDGFAMDKVGGFGKEAAEDLARCVRFIERALART